MGADMRPHYDGTPAIMADYACLARDAGARVIGGCCGTTPAHIEAMRLALAARPKAEAPPSYEEIEARLGSVKNTGEPSAGPKRERRRRRAG
jgi:5-methyltetrahydrofolate--homocysteine methyltransferase